MANPDSSRFHSAANEQNKNKTANMIDRKRWGLTPYRQWPKKEAEKQDEGEFFDMPSVCKVCDIPITARIHVFFRESFLTGFWGQGGMAKAESEEIALDRILKALRGMATCDRCYDARESYTTSRGNILEIANWVNRLFDPVSGLSKAEPEEQKKKQDILIFWTKKWCEALRKMTQNLNLIYCDDMAGIIWKRPNAADYYLDAIEQRIYNGSRPQEQIQSIKNLFRSIS